MSHHELGDLGFVCFQRRQRPAQDQLLHVAARQRTRRRVEPAAAHVEALHHACGMGARRAAPHPAEGVGKPAAADALGHGVFPQRQIAHHADAGAVFRDARHAAPGQSGGATTHRLAEHQRLAMRRHAQARQQFGQCDLPVAGDTGHGHDFARPQLQRHAAQALACAARRVHVVQRANHLAHRLRRLTRARGHGVADHPFGQLRFGGAGGRAFGHQPAAAQHGDPVRHAQHLAQLVADEDDRQALGHHLAQGGEQRLALLRGEHRRGFVQDQDARAAVQRLQYLDPLALAHRQVAHPRRRVHRQAELPRHRQQPLARGGAAREGLAQRLAAEHHVLQHRQVVGQREVLVHHADAGGQRGLGVARWQRRTEHLDAAFIGHVVPEQDGHQRGFAGAVLAQQRQHLAARQRERDAVVGHQRTEALGDAPQGEDGIGVGHRGMHGAPAQCHAARKASSTLAELSAASWKKVPSSFSPSPPPARSLSERKAM